MLLLKIPITLVNSYTFIEQNYVCQNSCFSQLHKVGNVVIIANFVFTYIYSFLLYLQQLMSVNMKLEIKGYMGIIFQGHMLYWNS